MFTPRQRKQAYEAVTDYGLQESDFERFIVDTSIEFRYKKTGFTFRLFYGSPPPAIMNTVITSHSLQIAYTPNIQGSMILPDEEVIDWMENWGEAMTCLSRWLAWIKKEYGPFDTITRSIAPLAPTPALSLAHLHPTIQQVAGSLFTSNHYPQAILAACTALDKAVQAKAKLPATTVGTTLMTTAFSVKSPLIQLSQDGNEQMGFMNLYQGSVQAIRNHYAHNLTEVPAPRALEWLSFISALFHKLG